MSLELSRDDHRKDYEKSIKKKTFERLEKNHPYTSSSKFS